MKKKIRRLVVCEHQYDLTSELGEITVIYDDNSIEKIGYNKAKEIMNKMYNSNLSSEEIDSRILFLTDKKYNNYIRKYRKFEVPKETNDRVTVADEKVSYYRNPNIDYDDIDLGLSIEDMKDPKRIRKKLNLIRKIKVRAFAIFMATSVAMGGFIFGLTKIKNKEESKGKLIKSEVSHDLAEKTKPNVFYGIKGKNFYELLSSTGNINQSNFMSNMNTFLSVYNSVFSKKHRENGIRPALKWDEVISLKLIYNQYNKNQIGNIFNGTELDSAELFSNYKDAIDQLRQAFVLQSYKSLASIDMLIDDDYNRKIYSKMNYMFLDLKNNGFSNKKKIDKFYEKMYKYVIESNNTRTNLILEPIFLATNDLLDDSDYENEHKNAISNYYDSDDYVNYCSSLFNEVSDFSIGDVNGNIPLYKQFKDTKIEQMKKNNCYRTNNRDLTRLSEYKKILSDVKVYDEEAYNDVTIVVDNMENDYQDNDNKIYKFNL